MPTLVSGGVCLGALLAQLLAQWVPLLYLSCAAAAAAAAVAIFHGWQHYDRRWSLSNLERGIDAEYRVGQVVDYALVPRNCAVAHGVVDIAAEGDIDHLVATPQALWVVETKVRAVPKKQFPAVLDRIARNVHAVEAWASGVPVRGCLVLLDGFPGKREYEARDGTPVVVHDEKSLRNALRREVRGEEGPGGAELARRVWKLGRVAS